MRGKEIFEAIKSPHGFVGFILIAVCWPLNWSLSGVRTAYLFFPLWLGYILAVDALVLARTGTSLLLRSRRDFALLFMLSAPVWWLFEVLNKRTANWEYLGRTEFSTFEYFALTSLCFSTVMPAVFETAELVRSFRFVKSFRSRDTLRISCRASIILLMLGLAMLTLLLLWPRYFYPFLWTSLVLIIEPINIWLGRSSLAEHLERGDWRPVLSLCLGALICGFFWEMWNYYSYPKWIYHVPGVDFLHVFEMPLLGYGGYIPFAVELYGLRSLVWGKHHRFTL